ncbi:MAG: prepilin-type N-terminal cleavage/methylation domain-containing protein [Woeseiaceae bacterium]|nr:prepilin-type N-terminal cleavage/methylation domain-containing protein [Woeseiaceae bacterium]
MEKRLQTGFTLYELMITLLIVGVILTLGVPNLQDFAANNRLTTAANDLHASFQLARSEAARAKTNVTICPSTNPFAGTANCGGNWNQGYIVFLDDDGDLTRNGASETVLRAHGPIDNALTLAIRDDATYFSYGSSGMGRGDIGGNPALSQVIICDERGVAEASQGFSAARLFVSTPLGRATIVRDLGTVQNALSVMGKSCP